MPLRHALPLALIASVTMTAASAQDDLSMAKPLVSIENLSVGLTAGSLGIGGEARYALSDTFAARAVLTTGGFSQTFDVDEASFDADLSFGSVLLLADYHPFRNMFRITGGAVINGPELTGQATGDVTLSDVTATDAVVDLDAGFANDVVPVVAIGLARQASNTRGFAISTDLGVALTGGYDVSLTDRSDTATFSSDILREAEEDAKDALPGAYPFISVTASFQF